MKRNVLVVDPSIMIHKIVQLAFPEEQYDVIVSNNYPLESEPEGSVHLALISADLPGHEDVLETTDAIKKAYGCPILLMIPKFHEHDAQRTGEAGIDGTIEKPFTSDALKERVAALTEVPGDLDDMESLSQEELESITDDEFMLSEEDLMDIGEDDLADVEIPEDLPVGVEPDTEELPEETGDETQTDTPEPEMEEAAPEERPDETEPLEEPLLLDSQQASEPDEDDDRVLDEPADGEQASDDMPFEDMGIEDDLDSIDFGELDDDDQLLAEDALKDLPQAAATEERAESEPPFDLTEEPPAEPESREQAEAEETEPEMDAVEAETPTPEPDDLQDASQLGAETEAAAALQSEEEPEAEEEDIDVDFAIEDEPRTVQLDEYEVERPDDEEEAAEPEEGQPETEPEPEPEPLDLSHTGDDHEVIHPPSSLSAAAGGKALLSDADIERIARRVVEVLGRDALKEVAWEVIPIVAEEVVRSRIRELEQEQD